LSNESVKKRKVWFAKKLGDPILFGDSKRPILFGDSKRPILRETETGQAHAIRRLGNLYLDYGRVGRGNFGRAQHCVLRKYFAVNFGDKMVTAGFILAPHLPEFDALHGH
jgi:hypothetical protein